MNRQHAFPQIASLFACLLLVPGLAGAAQRAWVSATIGVDTGICTRPAPCRTFTYAITQVNAGGEVNVLDSGGYGEMTITKAVTINVASGVTAGIIGVTGAAVTINAGATDKIVLRGLTISSDPTRQGIAANSFGTLHVENCALNGSGGNGFPMGISAFVSGTPAKVFIKDTVVRNYSSGILLGASGTFLDAEIDRSRMQDNVNDGVLAISNSRVAISRSVMSGNLNGVTTYSSTGGLTGAAAIEDSTLTGNGCGLFGYSDVAGISHSTLSGNTITFNNVGVCINNNAGSGTTTVLTRQNNTFARNAGGDVTGGALTNLTAK